MRVVLNTGSLRNCTMHSTVQYSTVQYIIVQCSTCTMHSPGLRSLPPEKCSHPKMLTKKRMAGTDQDITIIVITCTVDSVKMNPCDEEMKILDSTLFVHFLPAYFIASPPAAVAGGELDRAEPVHRDQENWGDVSVSGEHGDQELLTCEL